MRLRFYTSLVLTVLLAACSSAPPAVATAGQAGVAATPEATEAYREARDVDCQAAGGTLQRLGRLQREQCVIPYADAGKACSGKSDCTGQCLAGGGWPLAAPPPVPASVMPARTLVAASASRTARRRARSAWTDGTAGQRPALPASRGAMLVGHSPL